MREGYAVFLNTCESRKLHLIVDELPKKERESFNKKRKMDDDDVCFLCLQAESCSKTKFVQYLPFMLTARSASSCNDRPCSVSGDSISGVCS